MCCKRVRRQDRDEEGLPHAVSVHAYIQLFTFTVTFTLTARPQQHGSHNTQGTCAPEYGCRTRRCSGGSSHSTSWRQLPHSRCRCHCLFNVSYQCLLLATNQTTSRLKDVMVAIGDALFSTSAAQHSVYRSPGQHSFGPVVRRTSRVASKRVSFVSHTFYMRILLLCILCAYDALVRQDLAFSAGPMETGSAGRT